jgi:ribose transport system substrate-binding protein
MMNRSFGRKLLTVSLLAALVLGVVVSPACRKEEGGASGPRRQKGPGEKVVVGFSQMENDGPWRIAETKSMRDEAAKRADRFELLVTDARGETARQVSDVEDLVSKGVDAIFLAPREFEGLAPALQAAREAGIPVFLIDRLAAGTAGEDYVAFLGSNFIQQGQRAGEWLAQQTGGRAGIIELTGTAGSSVAKDRHDGFVEAISKHPEMKILASQTGNFSRAQGQRVMENLIQAHRGQITAVYAHNDEMALGAIQALKSAGLRPGTDVLVVSVDGQKSALEAIMAGEMNATVESNPRFGPLAFDTLERFLRGEKIEEKIILQDRFFDKSNAAQFVNEAY